MGPKDGVPGTPRVDKQVANSEPNKQDNKQDGNTYGGPISRPSPSMGIFSFPGAMSPQQSRTFGAPPPAFGAPSPLGNLLLTKSSSSEKHSVDEHKPTAKRMMLDLNDALRIEVGPQRRLFLVPRRLATSRSELLAKAASRNEPIYLPYDDANVFAIWLQIILQGHVVVDDEDSATEKEQQWRLLVQTYLLATSMGDVSSMNITMDAIVRRLHLFPFKHEPIAEVIKYTFDNTPPDSKLRRVFVNFTVYRATDHTLLSATGSHDFVFEVATEYMKWRDAQGPVGFGRGRGEASDDVLQYHVKEAAVTTV